MRVGIVRKYHPGIERAGSTVLETADVSDRMFCRRRIVPSYRRARGDRRGFGHEVGGTVVDGDGGIRRRRGRRPRAPCQHGQHGCKSPQGNGVYHGPAFW